MVRISDILKRGGDQEEEPQEKSQHAEVKEEFKKKEESQAGTPIEIARVMMEKTKFGMPQAKEIYKELEDLTRDLFGKAAKDEAIEGKIIVEKIDKLVNQMAFASEEFIGLIKRNGSDNYLYPHSVNVCILSILMGLGLGYNKSRLNELGVASLVHDIGMSKIIDLIQQPRSLTPEEHKLIKMHPLYGAEILEKAQEIAKIAIYVAQQEHERYSGTGYPNGLKNDQINEYARIIGLVDVYEALTHHRPHRKQMLPYEAMKEILTDKSQFDQQLLKVLITQIGIYPMGSCVLLNSDEIGRVVKVNKSYPLRPEVEVIVDPQGNKLDKAKTVDLSKHTTLYIKKPLECSELEAKLDKS